MRTITSVHNPRVKDAVRLRSARHRAKQGRILIDGARELARAIAGGVRLVELFVCDAWCQTGEAREAVRRAEATDAVTWSVPEGIFDKLSFGERRDGVLAVAETPRASLAALTPSGDGPIAVLAGVEKPGNVGAVLRSADGAGASAVIVADPGTDLYNPNCIRASLGTVFTMRVCAAASDEALAWLRGRGLNIFATRTDAERLYSEVQLGTRAAIVLGSEAHGLSGVWRASDITPIKLPMLGVADSLNVSATAAVLFYESLRQRGA